MEQHRSPSFMWVFPVLLAGALGMCGWGIYQLAVYGSPVILAGSAAGAMAVIAAWVLGGELRAGRQQAGDDQRAILSAVDSRLAALSAVLNQISEQQLISERAKAIAFRDSERDALRRAIAEETARKDWAAALALAGEMETVFGYTQEANRIRQELAAQQQADVQMQISTGLAAIDRYCRGEQWSLAVREAERLMAAYPAEPLTRNLLADIEARRQNLKKQLLDAWNDSVARHDVDGAIDALKQLDMYLTPDEVQQLQDTARQIFKDKLMQLGQQFGAAVKNHAWAEAVRLGELIINEFPNSRMAAEVREKIALLRERAAGGEPVRAG